MGTEADPLGTLLVQAIPGELRAALLHGDVPVELAIVREDEPSLIGACFTGRIARLAPAIPGAFVDLGQGIAAFMPGRTTLTLGTALTVQVTKDAHDEKLAEVRALAGPHPGVPETPLAQLLGRFAGRFDRLLFDRLEPIAEARRLTDLAIENASGIGAEIDSAFDEALASSLQLPGRGVLRFDEAAAFTAVDVDLAAAAETRRGSAETILANNLEAARSLARQLRLRNTGGAVIVDFVSMRRGEHRARVVSALASALAHDPVPTQIHGWTRLGHLELTRQRVRRPIAGYLRRKGEPVPLPAAIGWDLLRALARASFAAGGWSVRLHPAVAEILAGRLEPYLARVMESAGGLPLEIEPDPGIALGSFDIRPRKPHL